MSVIDLGEVRAHEPAEHPVAEPLPLRGFRRAAVAVVAIACALTLGAAAPVPPPLVRDVWSTAGPRDGAMLIGTDTVYLTGSQGEITAHDLATGTVRWSRTLDAGGGPSEEVAGLLLVLGSLKTVMLTGEDQSSTLMWSDGVIMLDPATGAERWRGPGDQLASTPDTMLLADRGDDGEARAMRLVTTRTGDVLWTRPLARAADAQIQYDDGRPARIVTTAPDEINIYRYADGAPLAHRGFTWTDDTRPESARATIAGDRLVVTWTDRRGSTVTAFRPDDLDTPLWSLRTLRYALVTPCGPVVCLAEGAEVSGLDPATGASRWQLPGPAGINVAGTGRLLAYTDRDPPSETLVDATTGRVLGDSAVGWQMNRTDPAARILLRAGRDDPDQVVISRMDLETGRVAVLGTVGSAEWHDCGSTARFLVCRRGDRVVVTAIG
ncbi:outer membrane protein assembly factor BamB family protein [Actinoplanes awajinensis]|uniref:Pyrrolo-quinoline quinone repeat domain-containing protein n=1 Tax=Actinoplanes awajinensis subsp. mycoplanecinus TaxID=135947 RepID=A0A0X3V7A4_9ACTN|nr:PQQ-binding-like beta-propeller repeat protein [Actinoplanes awajinensis]KUL40699.1 hypothetical protein ADL15_06860 [Actinoplanes awajinensis subsp. mycoplanecinus]